MLKTVRSFIQNYETSGLYLLLVMPVFHGAARIAESLDRPRIYLMFTLLMASTLLAAGLSVFMPQGFQFTPEHIQLFQFESSFFQQAVYVLFVASLFLIMLFFGMRGKEIPVLGTPGAHDKTRRLYETVIALLILFFTLPFIPEYLDIITERRVFLAVFGFLVLFTILLAYCTTGRRLAPLIILLAVAIWFFYIRPFSLSYFIPDGYLWGLDHHWSGVIGEGVTSSFQQMTNPLLAPEYGKLLSIGISWALTLSQNTDFGDIVNALQVSHLLFAALIFIILWQRFKRSELNLVLISFLLILFALAPVISNATTVLSTPNQSPIRFLFFPLTLIAAYLIARLKSPADWCIAAIINAIAIYYNPETGIATLLGLSFALFVKSMKLGWRPVLTGGLLYLVTFGALSYLISKNVFFIVPDSYPEIITAAASSPSVIQSFLMGFGGMKFYWNLSYFALLIHALYLFAGHLKAIRQKEALTAKQFQSITIIGIIIAFTPYVMNRFSEQNMWTSFLLYLLLVLPKMSLQSTVRQISLVAFLLIVIVPNKLGDATNFIRKLKHSWVKGDEQKCLLGLSASKELCTFVQEKALELKKASEASNVLWLSATPLSIMRFSGVSNSLFKLDPFIISRTADEETLVKQEIRKKSPALIMIDAIDDKNITGIPQQINNWQRRIITESGYKITRTSPYWIYAEKI